ncbi:hypothetical protein CK203_048802 [Vitis vinifera]|uniref:Uncharacterized protein n=1 Tax=Vitis vinifera TaxID=29760 RepID=A0A438GUA2_VITVI|nr:hypothetical protein CK203_048802 [Vitis vinifera]
MTTYGRTMISLSLKHGFGGIVVYVPNRLNFSDKKTGRGLPAGLVPVSDPFPEGDLPEVELIVGDTSKFEDTTCSNPKPTQDDNSDLYKLKLKEALPYYEKVMDKLAFQTHLNALVSKKARQFMFGFQAMEMMKVTSQLPSKNIGYQNFFEAFIEDKADYSLKDNEVEVELGQALQYIIFLVSPIFIVLLIALQKGT